MPAYQLNINISTADLQTIYAAKENIVLAKSVIDESPFSWVSFPPFESNAVTWDEQSYSVYASMTSDNGGVIVTISAEQAAQPSQNYTIDESGVFSQPVAVPIGPAAYQVTNQFSANPSLTFGLIQTVSFNGTVLDKALINAQFVPMGQHAIFRPTTQIVIFLASNIAAGEVVDPSTESGVISQPTTITFADGVFAATVTYDAATGTFVQGS
jgi:hypothetical protein